MAMQDSDFWRRMGQAAPGLFDLGVGLYGRNAAEKEAAGRLGKAQGPLYGQAMNLASGQLAAGGNFDPRAAAAERFNAQRGLLAGPDAKAEADMMRMLHSKGMLGSANYNPGVEGIAPGTLMNPHMAAFYAGRGARDARMAADSLDGGEAQLDRYLNRAGMLQRTASGTQSTGLEAQRTQPSRSASNMNLLKSAGGILKDTGMLKGIGDWFTNGGFSGQGLPFAPQEFDFGGLGDFDFDFGSSLDWMW